MPNLTLLMLYVLVVVLIAIYVWSRDPGQRRRALLAVKLLVAARLLGA